MSDSSIQFFLAEDIVHHVEREWSATISQAILPFFVHSIGNVCSVHPQFLGTLVAVWLSGLLHIMSYHLCATHNRRCGRRPFQARLNPRNGMHIFIILPHHIPIDKFPFKSYMNVPVWGWVFVYVCVSADCRDMFLTLTVTGSGCHTGEPFFGRPAWHLPHTTGT